MGASYSPKPTRVDKRVPRRPTRGRRDASATERIWWELLPEGTRIEDVAIVGAGVVGLVIAYHLSKLGRKVVVIEKEADVGRGVTAGQANVVHVIQLPFGSLKSRLARKGNVMYDDLCRELGVKLNRVPALLVVRGWIRLPVLFVVYLYLKMELRGQFTVQLMRGGALRRTEPLLADDISGGIVVHGYGTIDAQSLVSRLRQASENFGAVFKFGWKLTSVEAEDEAFALKTTGGEVKARFVVNAAGLYSDDVSIMLGKNLGRLEPGLGVMAVHSGQGLKCVVAPLPLSVGSRTKGGAIIPATDGTTIIGPTLRAVSSKEDVAFKEEDVKLLRSKFGPLLKAEGRLARVYTGVRPMSPTKDFIIDLDRAKRIVNLVGIESPGLTAAPAIAEMVTKFLLEEPPSSQGLYAGIDVGTTKIKLNPHYSEVKRQYSEALVRKIPLFDLLIFHSSVSKLTKQKFLAKRGTPGRRKSTQNGRI
jgi:glycerol-3-phosphate dehydrogenase